MANKTKKKAPTKDQRKAALKVIRFYATQARDLAAKCDQETPSEWALSFECMEYLLKGDPEKIMSDYEGEYDAGH